MITQGQKQALIDNLQLESKGSTVRRFPNFSAHIFIQLPSEHESSGPNTHFKHKAYGLG